MCAFNSVYLYIIYTCIDTPLLTINLTVDLTIDQASTTSTASWCQENLPFPSLNPGRVLCSVRPAAMRTPKTMWKANGAPCPWGNRWTNGITSVIDLLWYLMWGSLPARVSFFGMKCFQLGSGGHDPGIPQWLSSAISAAMIWVAGSFSQCFGWKNPAFTTYRMNGSPCKFRENPGNSWPFMTTD